VGIQSLSKGKFLLGSIVMTFLVNSLTGIAPSWSAVYHVAQQHPRALSMEDRKVRSRLQQLPQAAIIATPGSPGQPPGRAREACARRGAGLCLSRRKRERLQP